ncbi:Maf family protein [Gynurincola endophyticus]|uniref:Maf family protein n=1 Tax=Gynurincola endophyticus TaxID=2479004 RepID=UPI000F8C3B1E|nr:Maf family protein [Gynurincola endophyticus]
MYRYQYPVVLASASPRRKQLLEWAAIPFEVEVANTDEIIPENTPVTEVPILIAAEKAGAIQKKHSQPSIIIAADTIVVANEQILGKPQNRTEALEMLALLNGKNHTVITGVYIITPNENIRFSSSTEVSFNLLTPAELEFYVDQYQPYDKAGAYAIQEWIGAVGIEKITGDFYNVMGLPVHEVFAALKKFRL